MIVALGTRKQVGKDSVAQYLINTYGFKRLAFADVLKREVKEMLDSQGVDYEYNEENKETLRPLLIAWGEFRRALEPDYWLDRVIEQIKAEPDTNWVITDMRYPNEGKALKEQGAILFRLNRDTPWLKVEPTEAIGDLIEVDYEIDSNGDLETVYDQMEKILNDVSGNRLQRNAMPGS